MTDPQGDVLTRARISLALDQSFLASAITRLPFINAGAQSWCSTMATDGYYIFYNPEFVNGLTFPELKGVLAHEVLHAVLGHIDRRDNRDPEVWNIAADHAVNLLIDAQGITLPQGALRDRKFLGCPAEDIYAKLFQDHLASLIPTDAPAAQGSKPGEGTGKPSKGKGDGSKQPPGNSCTGGQGSPIWRDAHLEPDDPQSAGLRTKGNLDEEERRMLRRELASEMQEHLPGALAGYFEEEIRLAKAPPLNWRSLLRRWMSERVLNDWRSFPFAKKHLHRGIFMPSLGVESPTNLVFAVDTSASMETNDISLALADVEDLRSTFPCALTLLQFDTIIQDERTFEQGEPGFFDKSLRIKGRGGTDFRTVFTHMEARQDTYPWTVLIIVTDGYGPYPKQEPPYPVLWILTDNSVSDEKIPFGGIIRRMAQ